ncbi:MAG: hypothetical protein PHH09_13430 [Methanoregulaceae archaeon]|jgi:hypothetical protein|nr:hypothetical protein [Methanoregulaceae archaeon]
MADTVYRNTTPPVKAVDNGDATYSVAVFSEIPAGAGNTVFSNVSPPLGAIKLADGTYAVAVWVV